MKRTTKSCKLKQPRINCNQDGVCSLAINVVSTKIVQKHHHLSRCRPFAPFPNWAGCASREVQCVPVDFWNKRGHPHWTEVSLVDIGDPTKLGFHTASWKGTQVRFHYCNISRCCEVLDNSKMRIVPQVCVEEFDLVLRTQGQPCQNRWCIVPGNGLGYSSHPSSPWPNILKGQRILSFAARKTKMTDSLTCFLRGWSSWNVVKGPLQRAQPNEGREVTLRPDVGKGHMRLTIPGKNSSIQQHSHISCILLNQLRNGFRAFSCHCLEYRCKNEVGRPSLSQEI